MSCNGEKLLITKAYKIAKLAFWYNNYPVSSAELDNVFRFS